MKRIIAFFISISFLFLCACSNQNTNSETTTAAATTAQTTQQNITTEKAVEYAAKWGSDLLPENFPAPPEKTHDISVVSGKANKNYLSDWVRLEFTCPEHVLFAFSSEMEENGYIGGIKKISNGTYYTDGFKGYWQDGKHLVKISNTSVVEDNEVKFTIDILECRDNFPKELTEFFPKFNGFTKARGVYCGHDAEGNHETYDFDGTFASPSWHWDFRFTDGFIGVEETEFEAYYNKLGEEGFSGVITTATIDGCATISVNVTKEIGGVVFAAFLLYNQNLKTLDIAYTNEPSIYENN